MGGQFNNKNAGKRGISLNIRHPKGLQIAKDLVRVCDVVAEGFSPGVLQRLGLGYDVMKSIRPDIIYIQQSGMGVHGTYGRMRTVGPVAAAFGGQGDMSGLPEPAMPVGFGYSYLDWMGAYGYALALLGALYHRERTGEGQWIDASQCESGLFLTGATILDWSANEREFRRYGNRSPYKPAAPHGRFAAPQGPRMPSPVSPMGALAEKGGRGDGWTIAASNTPGTSIATSGLLDALSRQGIARRIAMTARWRCAPAFQPVRWECRGPPDADPQPWI
jgi:crotonobetainyl-CoA:carnitine CoA-transferase CaiB-like acyl-CoA transferase